MNVVLSRMGWFGLAALVVTSVGCEKWKWRSYQNLSEAKREVDQGWMPGKLPPSTHSIQISHHLDTGQAEVFFEFGPKEWRFFTELSESLPSTLPLNERRKHLVKEGYHFGVFAFRGVGGW